MLTRQALLFVSCSAAMCVAAERIYIMPGTGYNQCEPPLVTAIQSQGHTVIVAADTVTTLPIGFTTTCVDPVNGYDWLCLFGNADRVPLVPELQVYLDLGGKIYLQWEVTCCTISSLSCATIANTLTNAPIVANGSAGLAGTSAKNIRDSFVSGNEFEQNSVGIFMEGSSRNEIKENTFVINGYAFKLQASCDDNVISQNNFQQNTFDLVTNGSLVLNRIEKNYWDRYEGYDLDRNQVGDVPYRPISMYGMIVERMPTAVLLWRSFLVFLLDRAEKAIPVITPENLKDNFPAMRPYDFN